MPVRLTALFHGPSGIGKSWLGQTTPTPRLVIDAEGRGRYPFQSQGDRKVFWNPSTDPGPPEMDEFDTCLVDLTDYNQLSSIYTWLRSGQHPFRSVTLDSLMEIQRRCRDMVNPGIEALSWDNYGELLRRIEALVRQYRDLTLVPQCHIDAVIAIVGSEKNEQTGEQQLMLEGRMRRTAPYYFDVVGFLHNQPQADGSQVRSLLVNNQPGFLAKDATDLLPGPVIPNPNVVEMMDCLRNGQHEGVAA
jgi:hypothetical protein